MEPLQTIEISEFVEVWLSPEADLYLAIPNGNLTFYCMYSDTQPYPNAYPKFVWEKLGWSKLDDFKAKKKK
jgi:hypothetical protein